MAQKRKVPHTYVIVFFIILLAAVMTWIIPPGGSYIEETVLTDSGAQTQMRFYYQQDLPAAEQQLLNAEPQTWQVFSALFKGFVKQSNIIIFILMIGGAFWIMNQSKAIDVGGIYDFLRFTKNLEHNRLMKTLGVDNVIIALVMILFSVFGAVFGMSEETIAFAIIIVPLAFLWVMILSWV